MTLHRNEILQHSGSHFELVLSPWMSFGAVRRREMQVVGKDRNEMEQLYSFDEDDHANLDPRNREASFGITRLCSFS